MKNIVALLIVCALLAAIPPIYAAATQVINATVQISVCGNSVIEGGEDCEGVDLNSATCNTLGYSSGLLTCDIACTYDTTSCIAPTATPTLSPTATPPLGISPTAQPTPSSASSTSAPQTTINPTTNPATEVTPETESLINTLIQRIASIPNGILLLDPSGEGTIVQGELVAVLTTWVEAWQSALAKQFSQGGSPTQQNLTQCDINNDEECNIIDLSVLLFYVEP